MDKPTYDQKRPGFAELSFVFSQAMTKPLSPGEEFKLGTSLWKRRRRLRLALIWQQHPERFTAIPPEVQTHRVAISGTLAKRWLDAEERARTWIAEEGRGGSPIATLIRTELAAIDAEREELFNRNLRLVAWVARSFQGKGLDMSDLFQEGAIALLKAVERFDPARGARLGTFASHAIRLGLVRALAERGRMIRIPNYRTREVVDASKARSTLISRLGREPDVEEIEQESGLPDGSVEEILPALRPLLSMDAPIAGSELPLSDVTRDTSNPSPYDCVLVAETHSRAGSALSTLPERERRIVSMRYGLVDDEEHTYEEIGRALGLSRERARQLEKSAREKIRTRLSGVV